MNSPKTILLNTDLLYFSEAYSNAYLSNRILFRTYRTCLYRHYQREWIDQTEYISQANQLALEKGGQILTILFNSNHYCILE